MFSFTIEQLNGWIGQFIWPFVRILALIGTAPLFSESTVPVKVKVGLASVSYTHLTLPTKRIV